MPRCSNDAQQRAISRHCRLGLIWKWRQLRRPPRFAQTKKSTADMTSGATTPKAAMATVDSILIALNYFGGCSSGD